MTAFLRASEPAAVILSEVEGSFQSLVVGPNPGRADARLFSCLELTLTSPAQEKSPQRSLATQRFLGGWKGSDGGWVGIFPRQARGTALAQAQQGFFNRIVGNDRCQPGQTKIYRKSCGPGVNARIREWHLPDVEAVAESADPHREARVQNSGRCGDCVLDA